MSCEFIFKAVGYIFPSSSHLCCNQEYTDRPKQYHVCWWPGSWFNIKMFLSYFHWVLTRNIHAYRSNFMINTNENYFYQAISTVCLDKQKIIKHLHYCPFVRETTSDRLISHTKCWYRWKSFHNILSLCHWFHFVDTLHILLFWNT